MHPVAGVTLLTRLECWTELLLASVAIRSPWRERYLKAAPLGSRDVLHGGGVRSILHVLDRVAAHHIKPMTCLERSAAGQRILRRRGAPAQLSLGVRRSDTGGLEAHAWLEIEGEPLDSLASSFSRLESRGRGRLAGIRLLGQPDLSLPDDGAETDAECMVFSGNPRDGGAEEWQALPEPPGGGRASVTKDGRSVTVEGVAGGGPALDALLRWALPFASALQGRVILHASAVSRGGRAWAFVGESGAGKSTLAHALSTHGWAVVADDLLPCRLAHRPGKGAGGEPAAVSVLSAFGPLDLVSVFFVERTSPSAVPRANRLPPGEALRLLLHHGFGELSDAQIWRCQFEFYGTLAERVPAYRLEIPDDLGRLGEATALLEARMGA